jgi:hypothetical protein
MANYKVKLYAYDRRHGFEERMVLGIFNPAKVNKIGIPQTRNRAHEAKVNQMNKNEGEDIK